MVGNRLFPVACQRMDEPAVVPRIGAFRAQFDDGAKIGEGVVEVASGEVYPRALGVGPDPARIGRDGTRVRDGRRVKTAKRQTRGGEA